MTDFNLIDTAYSQLVSFRRQSHKDSPAAQVSERFMAGRVTSLTARLSDAELAVAMIGLRQRPENNYPRQNEASPINPYRKEAQRRNLDLRNLETYLMPVAVADVTETLEFLGAGVEPNECVAGYWRGNNEHYALILVAMAEFDDVLEATADNDHITVFGFVDMDATHAFNDFLIDIMAQIRR